MGGLFPQASYAVPMPAPWFLPLDPAGGFIP